MPHPSVFLLCSKFGDSLFVQYHNLKYIVIDHIISLSPVINFSLIDNYSDTNTKFILTSGFDKASKLNFVLEKFGHDIMFQKDIEEVEYLKSLTNNPKNKTKFIVVSFRNGNSGIFQMDQVIENISSKIDYNTTTKVLYANTIIEKDLEYILLIKETEILFYDFEFKLISDHKLKDNIPNIQEVRFKYIKNSGKKIILIDYSNNIYFFKMKVFKSINDDNVEEKFIKIDLIKLKEKLNIGSFFALDINNTLIEGKTLILLYLENHSIDIYDLDSLSLVFSNKLVSELPVLLINCLSKNKVNNDKEKVNNTEKNSDEKEKLNIEKVISEKITVTNEKVSNETYEGYSICQSDITLPLNIINDVSKI